MVQFEIKPEHPGQFAEVEARIKSLGAEFRGVIRQILEDAAESGRKVAEAAAPRGQGFHHDGGRIADSIQVSSVQFAPGGAGGGGFYTVRLYADSAIAPHLRYVFEGTGGHDRKIEPAHGNVLAFEKEGEGVKFRRWVHGQDPQTEWWEDAHRTVEAEIEAGIRGMNLGNL